jgi:hypothetical protein
MGTVSSTVQYANVTFAVQRRPWYGDTIEMVGRTFGHEPFAFPLQWGKDDFWTGTKRLPVGHHMEIKFYQIKSSSRENSSRENSNNREGEQAPTRPEREESPAHFLRVEDSGKV